MRKYFLTLAATVAVLSAGVFTTSSDAMTIGAAKGLGTAVDAAGVIEQVQHYRYRRHHHHYHYRGHYGYRGGYGYRRGW